MLIRGDLDGSKLRVWQTFVGQKDADGNIIIEEGWYKVDKVPDFPAPKRGIDFVMYFDINTKEFSFEEVVRELTDRELMEEQNELLKAVLAKLNS